MNQTEPKPGITAEAHSDDRMFEVPFDATFWFQQASDQEILKLAKCDWGGDYPADHVAEFMADHFPYLASMFKYIIRRDTGFECYVTGPEAMAWLKANKPELAKQIQEAD